MSIPNEIIDGQMSAVALDRFQQKHQQIPGGCWQWTARLDQDGYGVFTVRKHARRAHRIAYEHYVGLIVEGLVIDHLCRNRACVNPAHMEPVPNRLNVLRGVGVTAQNASATSCPAGHEYNDANTYIDSRGKRACRACSRERARRRPSRAKIRIEASA